MKKLYKYFKDITENKRLKEENIELKRQLFNYQLRWKKLKDEAMFEKTNIASGIPYTDGIKNCYGMVYRHMQQLEKQYKGE